jgi:hypothetical protein
MGGFPKIGGEWRCRPLFPFRMGHRNSEGAGFPGFLLTAWLFALLLMGMAVPAGMEAREAMATGATGTNPKDYRSLIPKMAEGEPPEDHYLLGLSISRKIVNDSYKCSDQCVGEHWSERWGPIEVTLKLVHTENYEIDSFSRNARLGLATYQVKRALYWRTLDDHKRRIRDLDESRKDSPEYRADKALAEAMPELERRLRTADAHAEDVRRMLRLLHGVTEYHYASRERTFRGRTLPASGPVRAVFSGAEKHHERWYGQEGWRHSAKLEPWSSADVARERDWTPFFGTPSTVRAIVWRFRPGDMARMRELISDLDAVKEELFKEGVPEMKHGFDRGFIYMYEDRNAVKSGNFKEVVPELDGYAAEVGLHMLFNQVFWNTFNEGLQKIVALAWMLSPHRPPEGLLKDDGNVKPGARLVLPPISSDILVQLRVKEGLFDSQPPAQTVSTTTTVDAVERNGRPYTYQVSKQVYFCLFGYLNMHTPEPSIQASGDAQIRLEHEIITINVECSGDTFHGDYTIDSRTERPLSPGYKGYHTLIDQQDVKWELSHMGAMNRFAPGAGKDVLP